MLTSKTLLACLFLVLTLRAVAAPLPAPQTLPADNITTNSATLHGASVWPKRTPGYVAFQIRKEGARWPLTHTRWQRVPRGQTNVVFEVNVTGLKPGTNYQFRTVRYIAGVTRYSATLGFATLLALSSTNSPTVATLIPTDITTNSATLQGSVNPNGLTSTAWFEWGMTTNYGNASPSISVAAGPLEPIQAMIGSLLPGTTYHFRTVATNSGGLSVGSDMTFVTILAPVAAQAETLPPGEVHGDSAVLVGRYNTFGLMGSVSVAWGHTTNYDHNVYLGQNNSPTWEQTALPISGLTPNTIYHYRFSAGNPLGGSAGEDVAFSTGVVTPPSVTTAPATTFPSVPPAYSQYAYLKGTVNPNDAATTVFFEWGTTTNYGNILAGPSVPAGTLDVPVQALLSPLVPATVYHFRIVAHNLTGTNYGGDLSFTSFPGAPTATTVGASDISGGAATLLADVNPVGAETSAHFDWGTTTNYGNSTLSVSLPAGTSVTRIQAGLSGLSIGAIYHFRVVASNSAGASYGQDVLFDTSCAPGPGVSVVTNCTEAELLAAIASGNTIQFACVGTIGLSNTIIITNSVTIDGCGQSITLSGNNAVRLFHVTESGSLYLRNVTLAYGRVASSEAPSNLVFSASGGAVLSQGALQADACRFLSNSVAGEISPYQGGGRGGAIYATTGSVVLLRSQFNFNSASQGSAGGGALYVETASARMMECSFANNQAVGVSSPPDTFAPTGPGRGGAIFNGAGNIELNRCALLNNSATGGEGWEYSIGAIPDGNGLGGAILNGGVMVMTNCTLSGNRANLQVAGTGFPNIHRAPALFAGGAVFNSGQGWIAFSTIANNRALRPSVVGGPASGGGCLNTNGTLTFASTVLSGNLAVSYANVGGPVLDLGHNLSSDATPVWSSGTSLNNTDPLLGPLSDNGGFTLTFALLPGSPAIDAADPLLAPATDQRGVARPQGPAPDIGSYER